MNYKILGKPFNNQYVNYKGLYREEPMLVEETDNTRGIVELWEWYANQTGDGGFIHDRNKAIELINKYKFLGERYELVRVELEFIEADNFLGIDICNVGGDSLLSSNLEFCNFYDQYNCLKSIFELMKFYFQPKLNKHQLFTNQKVAKFFLDNIISIQELSPGAIEEDCYNMVYLYNV